MKRLKQFSALAIFTTVFWGHAQAGKLSDFEDDVTKEKKKEEEHRKAENDANKQREQQRRDQDRENYQRQQEWDRERERARERNYPNGGGGTVILLPPTPGPEDYPRPPRRNDDDYDTFAPPLFGKNKVGELIIPYFRFDLNQGELASSITEKDYQLEIGYGPFALLHKETNLVEDKSHDELKSQQTFFLYRMNITKATEIDLGLGEYNLEGHHKNHESAYSLGFKWHDTNGFGAEYRPMWVRGNDLSLSEHEISFFYGQQFVAVKLGYHWMMGDTETLKGPFLGFSFAY